MNDASSHAPAPQWKETPRYWRDPATGRFHRVAYRRAEIVYHVGGRGPTPRTRFQVWNPGRGATWEEAGEAAAAGEQFGQVLTAAQFARLTYGAEDLPPIGRAADRPRRRPARDRARRRRLTFRHGAVRRGAPPAGCA